jgi:phage host-nuclease inhibitor protein Gam
MNSNTITKNLSVHSLRQNGKTGGTYPKGAGRGRPGGRVREDEGGPKGTLNSMIATILSDSPLSEVQSRQQLDALVENIVKLQHDRAEMEGEQERELTAVRQKFRAPLAELDRYIALESAWVETWARRHRGAFGGGGTLACTHATIGFRPEPPRVERVSGKWSWPEIALRLSELLWGRRYVQTAAPEVNAEAILADRANLSAGELRKAGLKIVEDERFFIAPHGPEESGDPAAAAQDPDWQEAA